MRGSSSAQPYAVMSGADFTSAFLKGLQDQIKRRTGALRQRRRKVRIHDDSTEKSIKDILVTSCYPLNVPGH